jgi:hypothetical protein
MTGEPADYLVGYGVAGDFGRFRPVRALACRRGDRAVVRSPRGLELGVVLGPAAPLHAQFLPNTSLGQILRLADPDDEQAAERMRQRGQAVFEDGRRLSEELGLPLEVLDVEVLLDGEQAIVHHLRWGDLDERPFVSTLSRRHELHVALLNLAPAPPAEEHGCGKPGCGRTAGGGCGTCGSGGGCSSCGAGSADLQAYFADLRRQMAEHNRTPLL